MCIKNNGVKNCQTEVSEDSRSTEDTAESVEKSRSDDPCSENILSLYFWLDNCSEMFSKCFILGRVVLDRVIIPGGTLEARFEYNLHGTQVYNRLKYSMY